MKKFCIIAGAITAAILILLTGLYLYYRPFLSKPSVRFLMHMSELKTPDNFTTEEKTIPTENGTIQVMHYRHKTIQSDKYYVLVHGLTPQEYNHPTLNLLAGSICDATGMNVLKPYMVFHSETELQTIRQVIEKIKITYHTLYKHFPGEYRGLGACIGASAILIALEELPRDMYPGKLLLIGPVFDGRWLVNFYNKRGVEVDFIVKLANSMNNMEFSDEENKLIGQAFKATKPGPTDKQEMKKILGQGLFNDILMMKIKNDDFENINLENVLTNNKTMPNCEYFILHTNNDVIVPKTHGVKLYEFMKKKNYHTNFIGTELYDHTKNIVNVSGFIKEMKYLIEFYDALFKGDTAENQ